MCWDTKRAELDVLIREALLEEPYLRLPVIEQKVGMDTQFDILDDLMRDALLEEDYSPLPVIDQKIVQWIDWLEELEEQSLMTSSNATNKRTETEENVQTPADEVNQGNDSSQQRKTEPIKCDLCEINYLSSVNRRRHKWRHRAKDEDEVQKKRERLADSWSRRNDQDRNFTSINLTTLPGPPVNGIIDSVSSYLSDLNKESLSVRRNVLATSLLRAVRGEFTLSAKALNTALIILTEDNFMRGTMEDEMERIVFPDKEKAVILAKEDLLATFAYLVEYYLVKEWNREAEEEFSRLLEEEERKKMQAPVSTSKAKKSSSAKRKAKAKKQLGPTVSEENTVDNSTVSEEQDTATTADHSQSNPQDHSSSQSNLPDISRERGRRRGDDDKMDDDIQDLSPLPTPSSGSDLKEEVSSSTQTDLNDGGSSSTQTGLNDGGSSSKHAQAVETEQQGSLDQFIPTIQRKRFTARGGSNQNNQARQGFSGDPLPQASRTVQQTYTRGRYNQSNQARQGFVQGTLPQAPSTSTRGGSNQRNQVRQAHGRGHPLQGPKTVQQTSTSGGSNQSNQARQRTWRDTAEAGQKRRGPNAWWPNREQGSPALVSQSPTGSRSVQTSPASTSSTSAAQTRQPAVQTPAPAVSGSTAPAGQTRLTQTVPVVSGSLATTGQTRPSLTVPVGSGPQAGQTRPPETVPVSRPLAPAGQLRPQQMVPVVSESPAPAGQLSPPPAVSGSSALAGQTRPPQMAPLSTPSGVPTESGAGGQSSNESAETSAQSHRRESHRHQISAEPQLQPVAEPAPQRIPFGQFPADVVPQHPFPIIVPMPRTESNEQGPADAFNRRWIPAPGFDPAYSMFVQFNVNRWRFFRGHVSLETYELRDHSLGRQRPPPP